MDLLLSVHLLRTRKHCAHHRTVSQWIFTQAPRSEVITALSPFNRWSNLGLIGVLTLVNWVEEERGKPWDPTTATLILSFLLPVRSTHVRTPVPPSWTSTAASLSHCPEQLREDHPVAPPLGGLTSVLLLKATWGEARSATEIRRAR